MIAAGAHWGYVWAAYGVAALSLGGLTLATWLGARKRAAELARLEGGR